MLWTDTDFLSTSDLLTLDSEVADVATAESITLDGGNGLIHRAIEECGDSLMKHLQVFGGATYSGAVSPNHFAAVMNTGLPAVNRSKILQSQIVVNGLLPGTWSPIKRWAAYWSLVAFYRDAANRTNQDRYKIKQEAYQKDRDKTYWPTVLALGVPYVNCPLPAPGALYDLNTGSWSTSNVAAAAGSGTQTGAFDVVITWFNGNLQQNNESYPSARQTVTLTSGQVVSVNLAGLNPPTGQQPPSTMPWVVIAYGVASGWNIYAGPQGGPLFLQNSTPIPIGTKAYVMPGNLALSGQQVGNGQWPDQYMAFNSGQLQRG